MCALLCGACGTAVAAEGFAIVASVPNTFHERAGEITVAVQRSSPLGASTSVDFRTIDGTAVAGRDFVATRGTLAFGPEDRTRTLTVALLDTSAILDKASFRVQLENLPPGAYFSGPYEMWATILDDGAVATILLEFAVSPALAVGGESQGTVSVAVVRTGPSTIPVAVRFGTVPGTARAGEDFVALDGVLEFGVGETLKTLVVTLINDRIPEADETFAVELREPAGGAVLGPTRTASIRVRDDDAPAALEPTFRLGRGLDDRVRSMVRQPDGQLVVAGDFNFAGGVRRDEVARFHPDGSLDASFDPGPTLRGRLGLGGMALALQSDGKVLVGGDFTSTNDVRQPILVRLGADGAPDPTFVPATSSQYRVRAIAVQEDGRILIGGTFSSPSGVALNVSRLNPDGAADPAFVLSDGPPNGGTQGGGYLSSEVLAMAVQSDGHILLGGNFLYVGAVSRPHVARLRADGALDRTFAPGSGASEDVKAFALEPDGQILVAGEFAAFNGQVRWRIARLNADGSLDPTFAPDPGANREIHALALQPNGQILIGGEFTEVNGVPRGRLARLNADGSLDPDFNPGAGADEEVRALAWAPDAVYAGGDFTLFHGIGLNRLARLRLAPSATDTVSLMLGEYAVRENAGAVKLTVRRHGESMQSVTVPYATVAGTAGPFEYVAQSGTIALGPLETEHTITLTLRDDPVVEDAKTFSVQLGEPQGAVLGTHTNAIVTLIDDEVPSVLDPTFAPPLLVPEIHALALQPDGGLLLGGSFAVQFPGHGLTYRPLARLNPDGSPDTNFVPTLVGARVRTILILPQGQIVVGGELHPSQLARFHADGARDATFASATFNNEVRVVARTQDGQLLAGGDFTSVDALERKRIVRLTANGEYDPTFYPGNGANDQVLAIQEQPDRRVLIAGRFTKVHGIRRTYVARLEANGQLDTSFNALPNDRVRSMVLLPDGRLLVGGRFTEVGGVDRLYLARLNADGSLDPTFAPAAIDEEVRSVSMMADGRLVVAGEFSTVAGFPRNRVARLNPDGSLDALFQPGLGADGTVWVALPLDDGRIVIGGEFWGVAGQSRPAIARLNAEQPPGLEVLPPLPGSAFGLRLYGVPPNLYELTGSTDLVDWQSLGRRQFTEPAVEWRDPDATPRSYRFYRASRVK